MNQSATEPLTELQRQTDLLVQKGYPALAGLTDEAFRAIIAPLESRRCVGGPANRLNR